ncbi:glycoside hydrolase family 5 protein [Dothidotthia symphoricarpi CBS 119687]|uniref:Glycoside hydrolase family 5 protein n=1 Tax=Dothidotthia symphoricarpi CBS 119687 TaxID=1392245 RepID=A0A6A6AHP0_9PLEO|nr:glycoside hydrolase family 5 protein [Dothidotthia symphoricarpi CBS 119687]KAF2130608.1 glycoside hydrolase family 5 protein [Dothidotthia symphoricarpi CBS 119687]
MLFDCLVPGLLLSSLALAFPSPKPRQAASVLPLSTKGRDIVDANGDVFHYVSSNWPGHQEIMIPEGLQHSSVKDIVSWFPKLGLNSVRLTFAIEMVDDYYSNSTNQSLEKSVINALGQTNGTIVLDQILSNNPQFTKETTRLEVFDDVAKELASQGVILHLDNHVSKAFWCCGDDDGNGWFGEKYFDVENWKRGLAFMAKHAKENWGSFSSIGLRNELRSAKSAEPVDWYTWYVHMTAAADAVHEANSDALIFFSGMSYDIYIDPIPLGKTLNGTAGTSTANKTAKFVPDDFAFKNKIVLEIHKYDFENTQDDCATFISKWYQQGFQSVNPDDPATKYLFPMVISEWGFIQNGVYWNQTTYAECLIEMVDKYQVGWQHWDLAGSYYLQTRPGRTPETIQAMDESWGLLNYDWTAIRSPVTLENSLYKMIDVLK